MMTKEQPPETSILEMCEENMEELKKENQKLRDWHRVIISRKYSHKQNGTANYEKLQSFAGQALSDKGGE